MGLSSLLRKFGERAKISPPISVKKRAFGILDWRGSSDWGTKQEVKPVNFCLRRFGKRPKVWIGTEENQFFGKVGAQKAFGEGIWQGCLHIGSIFYWGKFPGGI